MLWVFGELDLNAWMIYARAAKVLGQTLGQVLTHVLIEEDCAFEERGFKTRIEREDERDSLNSRTARSVS